MQQTDVLLWLKEAWQRLGKKSPIFFRVVGTISLVFAVLGFIPELFTYLEIPVPVKLDGLITKIMFIGGIWGKFIAMFAVKDPDGLQFTEKKTNSTP